jgi:hypothetical protein
MSKSASVGIVFWLALGCSASVATTPPLRQEAGGASGTGIANSAGATSAGGSLGSGGAPSAGAPASSAAGAAGAAVAHAGASGGGAAGSLGGASAAGAGNTGPVTVGLPFTEDFETDMIAPNLWTAIAAQVVDPGLTDWSVVGDDTGKAAQLNADGTERFIVGGNSAWTDQKLELRVQTVSGKPEIDIAFRFNAVKEYYYLEYEDSHFKVRDRTGANSDITPTGTKPKVVLGTWYKITLQIKGTAVTAALDDTVVASGDFATTPIPAGGIAIGVGSGSGVVLFDDIHVTAP